MAIEGVEWIFVAVIVIVLILWDPSKIPKIAKALGEAKREFEKASIELRQEVIRAGLEASDEKLIDVARSLGITTEGKTKDEISEEILRRAGVELNNKMGFEQESR